MKLLSINCTPDLSYFTKRGLSFEIDYATTDKVFPLSFLYTVKDQSGKTVNLFTPNVTSYLNSTYKEFKYDIILVGWNPKDYTTLLDHSGGYTYNDRLNCGSYYISVRNDNNANGYIVHELHHALYFVSRRFVLAFLQI